MVLNCQEKQMESKRLKGKKESILLMHCSLE